MFQNLHIRKFIIWSLVVAAVCTLLVWILSQTGLKQHYFVGVYFIIPFIMLVTILVHAILVTAAKNDPKKFIARFMASSGIKLLLYLVVIFIYALFIKRDVILFVISFFTLYIIFTVIEISVILNYLKKN